ncbi:MAG: GGDEF domain-containing protein [Candidatus Woesebacteria bacterium]|nr:GGDEF domain-containing protein [Candidatus Woesebacteria bacterium]
MTDKVKEDFQFEGAKNAHEDLGNTDEGRRILSSEKGGAVILDTYEREAKLKSENIRDAMTGLFNYGYLMNELDTKTKEQDNKLALIWVDMDNLKVTNDSIGHEAGTDVVKGVARVVANKIRSNENGLAARYGGDEFVILLPGHMNLESLKQRGEEIRKAVFEAKFRAGGANIHQTVSIGVGLWNGVETAKQFLERVDKAMYEAKKKGRNLVIEAE